MTPHRTTAALAALATLLALASAPARASAGEPHAWGQARGFSAGLVAIVDGMSIGDTSDPNAPHIDDMGGGLALAGGYTFTPHFHLGLTLGSARHATNVTGLDVEHGIGVFEAQYRFAPERQVTPYVAATLGGAGVRADHGADHLQISAGAAGIGAGVRVGLSTHVVMDVSGRLEAINWHDATWSHDLPDGSSVSYHGAVEESGGASRLQLGFFWDF